MKQKIKILAVLFMTFCVGFSLNSASKSTTQSQSQFSLQDMENLIKSLPTGGSATFSTEHLERYIELRISLALFSQDRPKEQITKLANRFKEIWNQDFVSIIIQRSIAFVRDKRLDAMTKIDFANLCIAILKEFMECDVFRTENENLLYSFFEEWRKLAGSINSPSELAWVVFGGLIAIFIKAWISYDYLMKSSIDFLLIDNHPDNDHIKFAYFITSLLNDDYIYWMIYDNFVTSLLFEVDISNIAQMARTLYGCVRMHLDDLDAQACADIRKRYLHSLKKCSNVHGPERSKLKKDYFGYMFRGKAPDGIFLPSCRMLGELATLPYDVSPEYFDKIMQDLRDFQPDYRAFLFAFMQNLVYAFSNKIRFRS